MSIAEEMLAKAGVKTEEKPAGPAEGAGAAINSEGANAGEKEVTQGASATPPADAPKDGDDAEKKTAEPVDRTKDGTVTVVDLNPPTDAPKETGSGSSDTSNTVSDTGAGAAGDDPDFEAKVLEFLAKKAGKEIKTLDEILKPAAKTQDEMTEEEKVAAQEKFNSDAVRYALDKQLFSTKDLEAYNIDKAKPHRDIAFRVFTEETLAMDEKLAEEYKKDPNKALAEIEERFQDVFFEHEEDDDWRRVRGQATMRNIAEGYINHKYGSVLNASEAFKEELDTQQSAVVYSGNVEKVFSELPDFLKITIDGKEFSYQVPETTRKSLKDQFLKPETFARFNNGAIEEKELRSTVNNALFSMEQQKFITEVCKAYASTLVSEIKMGRKNIPVGTDPSGTSHAAGGTSTKTLAEVMLEKATTKTPPLATAKP